MTELRRYAQVTRGFSGMTAGEIVDVTDWVHTQTLADTHYIEILAPGDPREPKAEKPPAPPAPASTPAPTPPPASDKVKS